MQPFGHPLNPDCALGREDRGEATESVSTKNTSAQPYAMGEYLRKKMSWERTGEVIG